MGIETAAAALGALGSTAGAAAGTAAGAAGALGTGAALGSAAAGTGAALGAAEATAAAATGALAGTEAIASGVAAIGGDGLGALIALNGPSWGIMGPLEAAQGFMGAVMEAPVMQSLGNAMTASDAGGQDVQISSGSAQAEQLPMPNQGSALTGPSSLAAVGSSQDSDVSSLEALGLEDGGVVPRTNLLKQLLPDNIFDRTRQEREQQSGVTINVNTSQPQPQQEEFANQRDFFYPEKAAAPSKPPARQEESDIISSLINLIRGHADGGKVRSGAADAKAGGKIRGPQSETGHDNQIIKVAGGEGILPVDVMEVEGVPELVRGLIQAFHTPVK